MAKTTTAAIKQALGAYGEALAARHLVEQGMVLLDRNWRCDAGEIDLVLRDGEVLVVCEVNTRSKFRAWDSMNKAMVHKGFGLSDQHHDELEHACGVILPLGDTTYAYMNGLSQCPRQWDLDPMQFTGLQDKNGQDIYEGDIVERIGSGFDDGTSCYIAAVVWDEHQASWKFSGLNPQLPWLVIGNSYENPDLLDPAA